MKVVVIEDADLAREGLLDMLSDFSEITVVGSAADAEQAHALIQQARPDALFLDIHMPRESGFDLLAKLDYEPKIIFTTAYSEYAIRSFDFYTIDYLLKPISQERLAKAIDKLVGEKYNTTTFRLEKMNADHQLFVKDKDNCFLVALADIRCFESCKNQTRIHFQSSSAFIHKNLSQVEARLPQNLFFRANRQWIINLRDVENIEPWVNDGFLVRLSDGKEIDISRRHAARLKTFMSF